MLNSSIDNVNGPCYYRLRMIDIDGKITYSKIEKVKGTNTSGISVYPNPTRDFLTINNPGNKTIKKIIIKNSLGQTMLEKNINFQKIDVSDFSVGTYVIVIFSTDETYQFKIVKL